VLLEQPEGWPDDVAQAELRRVVLRIVVHAVPPPPASAGQGLASTALWVGSHKSPRVKARNGPSGK